MNIRGSDAQTRVIQLRLRSTSVKCECHVRPIDPYDFNTKVDYKNVAVIAFDDSREIDALIDMLARFKKDNIEYLGEWR